jgi:hypothetical protein
LFYEDGRDGIFKKLWKLNLREDKMTDKINDILADRRSKYGDYSDNARVTQCMMNVLMTGVRSNDMNDMQREAVHMILHKLSRIANGDPNHQDSWDDIAGYARLVSERIPDAEGKSK